MVPTTLRHVEGERPAAATYWRRRFVALVIGLSVLALVTWALSGVMGGSSPAVNRSATNPVHGTLPSPAPRPGSGKAHQHGSGSTRGASGQHRSTVSTGTPGPCPASDIVLSIFSSQATYAPEQSPEFEVDVVSVDSQACTFNIGARHVWLQVMASRIHIWSSAECAEGEASMVTTLKRGVPTVVPIGWDGQMSGPGCPGPGTKVAAGSYTAFASDGSGTSSSLPFRLG
jgi:hypothetical protein